MARGSYISFALIKKGFEKSLKHALSSAAAPEVVTWFSRKCSRHEDEGEKKKKYKDLPMQLKIISLKRKLQTFFLVFSSQIFSCLFHPFGSLVSRAPLQMILLWKTDGREVGRSVWGFSTRWMLCSNNTHKFWTNHLLWDFQTCFFSPHLFPTFLLTGRSFPFVCNP